MDFIQKHKFQEVADKITTGAAQIANTPAPIKPIVSPPISISGGVKSPSTSTIHNGTSGTNKGSNGGGSISTKTDYQTSGGTDWLGLVVNPLLGGMYLLGQEYNKGNVEQQKTTATGLSSEQIATLFSKATPTPTPTAAASTGFNAGDIGGIIDKVIIAGVIIGAISLLKGVFK